MLRLRRHLFSVLVLLSLLLCVVVSALWVRSGPHADWVEVHYIHWPRANEFHRLELALLSYSSTLEFACHRTNVAPAFFQSNKYAGSPEGWRTEWPAGLSASAGRDRLKNSGAGFSADHGTYHSAHGEVDMESWSVAVPDWLPFTLFLVMPALWLNRLRTARRARRLGQCPTCGYDLRASPDRCPECGAARVVSSVGATE